jgi:protein Mpv17
MRQAYIRQLEKRPIATKALSAFVLGFWSNLIASFAENGSCNMPRALKYGLMNCPPYSHFWFPFLDSLTTSVPLKLLIDQLIWRPLLIGYTFVGMGLFQGLPVTEIKEILDQRYCSVVYNGLKLWPAVAFFNLQVVPLQFRSLTLELVSFFWGIYVSVATGGKKSSEGAETPGDDGIDKEADPTSRHRICSTDSPVVGRSKRASSVAEDELVACVSPR